MTLLERKEPMTIETFLAFTDTRPDEERWELLDGEPVLNPSPSYLHQKIVLNLSVALAALERDDSVWEVLPGLGVKLSETSMPVPDILLRPKQRIKGFYCDDMIVAIEVLSPSSRTRDLRWKRQAYANLPSLEHYVVVQQDEITVRCFDRTTSWAEDILRSATQSLTFPSLGISLPLTSVYRATGL